MEGHVLTCRASFSSLVRCTPSSTLAPRAVKATAAMSSLYRRLVTHCRSQDSWGEISVNALKIESSFKKIYIQLWWCYKWCKAIYIYESSTLQIHRMPAYPPDLAGFLAPQIFHRQTLIPSSSFLARAINCLRGHVTWFLRCQVFAMCLNCKTKQGKIGRRWKMV